MSNCCASVVFVHGLTGGQLTTWTAEGAPAPWPELLLSEDIPDARISAFGYDADVVKILGQAGQNRIRQHARNLLAGLADMRFEESEGGAVNSVGVFHCKSSYPDILLIYYRLSCL